MIYCDANATEPVRPESLAAVMDAMRTTGNPSSSHKAGRVARALLDQARRTVSKHMGGSVENCVFTSGGTEANVLAVRGIGQGRRILIGATEHDAVRRAPEEGARTGIIPVSENGIIDCEALETQLVSSSQATLVCVMLANNETGVINPIREISRLCRKAGAKLHVDAVQAAGRVPVDILALGADSIAVSGHKFGGPKGAGALLLADQAPVPLSPMLAGGGQERGRRGGTPALPAIMGMAAALDAALASPRDLSPLRDAIEMAALQSGAILSGTSAPRLANTTCLILPWMKGEAQLIALDLDGFCVSAGAACSSGKAASSHVLEAMGFGELSGHAIRVSLPWNVEADVAERFSAAYERMAARRRPI
ncbi:cysteine desulfurase family protein [Acetobacter fallax]|uniref:Cysteine desulfurase n=1 Tax=Acetobacter fallax TaxID=1737473 RepID=A0ABX0K9N0_9PROT|nr:cysteine desulfurase family protein [Acetobacter fallax]NHO32513.1 aminotransferase class V-fold PLP-dependent enzyme [Acetobacter fallax]NHO36143.1 aminotransferase class V-fold PLP-dependent enzyme [Acetobacter fallax]